MPPDAVATGSSGPVFSHGGPDATRYGEASGYPVPSRQTGVAQGNPWSPGERVGAFSHLDQIYPTRRVARANVPWNFARAGMDLHDRHPDWARPLMEHLARHPVTGLLIAKDDRVLFEHYQYGRSDADRLLGQSMTKSMVGLLVGLALADGALDTVDDLVQRYVPGLSGSEYGRTPLRALLQMSSGVDFGEERDGGRDLSVLWREMVLGAGWFGGKGTLASLRRFDTRVAAPGTRFHYASIEPDVLAVVLRQALRRPLSDYLHDKLWEPLGAEADATWLVDTEGNELGHFGFSAVLRDYARLGRLLACDGAWNGRQLLPEAWVREATTPSAATPSLVDGSTKRFGYGYLMWLLPGSRRQFAMVGQNGQRLCIDPASGLVMVHTALEDVPQAWSLWATLSASLA